MARVYLAKAVHAPGEKLVALKVIAAGSTREQQVMFRHEAQVSASLRHPNIVEVVDVGVSDEGDSYLVMELVHGATLREVLAEAAKQGRVIPIGFGVAVAIAAAAGLHHAHEKWGPAGPLHIVHRDVSPANLMVGHTGGVKVIDFGIARSRVKIGDTPRGIVKGKASYMSPEQLTEDPVDRRSDVFSLGIVAYEATTQSRAFLANSDLETARRVIASAVRPPSTVRRGYPPELAEVIAKALSVDPGERYPTSEAFGAALRQAANLAGVAIGPEVIVDTMRALFPVLARGTGSHPVIDSDLPTTRMRRPPPPELEITPPRSETAET